MMRVNCHKSLIMKPNRVSEVFDSSGMKVINRGDTAKVKFHRF